MTEPAKTGVDLRCDLLLLTVTSTEQEQLLEAAADLGIAVTKRPGKLNSKLYDLGKLGAYRVLAIRSRMGALGYGGSASMAQIYRAATQATGIIAVGMAFGMSNRVQNIGEVLVSTGMFPYDDRDVVSVNGAPEYRYERAKHRPAKPSLVKFLQGHAEAQTDFHVRFGALLSGGARIQCAAYRDALYRSFTGRGESIVGGEMEAVGLLSCSEPKDPWWIVVKGISDFADENRDIAMEDNRLRACRNAARFVLASLCQATAADNL